MKDSVKYAITAAIAIVVIVAMSVFIRSGNQRFSQTLEQLNNSLTSADAADNSQPPVSNVPVVDIILDDNVQVGQVPTDTSSVAPSAEAVPPAAEASDVAPSQAAPSGSGAPAVVGNNPETLTYLNNAVNTLRTTPNFTAIKDQVVDIQLTDCSVSSFTSIINGFIKGLTGDETYTYTFANGMATDPEERIQVSVMTAIPPTDKDFTLMADGIDSLTSVADGTNTVYTIVLKSETTTAADPVPYYHGNAMDYLDITDLDLPIEVTAADFVYTGATIDITVDDQGRVVKLHENMPINAYGAGKLGFLSANATIEGYLDETWTVTY